MTQKKKNSIAEILSLLDPRAYIKSTASDHGFHEEGRFQKELAREKRKTERSQKPFLLMLIDIKDLVRSKSDVSLIKKHDHNKRIRKVENILIDNTREVDLKGWYRSHRTVGIIFTEIDSLDINFVKNKLHTKLCDAFSAYLEHKISIALYKFPQESKNLTDIEKYVPDLDMHPDTLQPDFNRLSLLFKRMLDMVGSIAGIVVLCPIMLIIPIIIKLSSDGPVFFRQKRMGRHGEPFTFLKFRTMYVNNNSEIHQEFVKNLICNKNENNGNGENGKKAEIYKIQNDPRVTPLGRFLRKTSIDEIPQFFNVLKGDMSLVGPRPPIPYELEHYDLWHQRRVLELKPGITGIWQVHGRSSTTFDEMVRMDINYINRWSLMLDIKLLFMTPWVMLTGKGAH
jgi:lipopolysaccharide/colanic/teichoic acid biosynthesis glycosyltransferase